MLEYVIQKHGILGEQIYINKKTRVIKRLHPYSLREEPNDGEIEDLLKADLVKKD